MAIGKFNSGGGQWIPPIGFVWLSTENVSPEIYFENTTWELISQNRVLMGAGDGHNGGDTVEAGLPNITGTASLDSGAGLMRDNSLLGGAFGRGFTWAWQPATQNYTGNSLTFDASKSNAIYGASDTVQPPAFYVYM